VHLSKLKPLLICSTLSLVVGMLISGCSVVMASRQPSKKDLTVLKPGTERDRVIAELGVPVSTEKLDSGRKDIYTFIQGYTTATKVSRAVFHSAADVFTIGLWEAVGTPIEGAFDGKRISVRVIYDSKDLVQDSTTLSVSDP
jgi:uncharacterized protein YceK